MKRTLFAKQHKLKLVTYCQPDPGYQQHIVLEYLAYRLYNVVTPLSFRVRPAEVTYRSSDSDKGVTRFGYLIEDIDDVAGRNGRERLAAASREVAPTQMDARAAGRAALFEYMISNLDWDFLAGQQGADCCHNTELLAAPGASPATARDVVPVPYDFDMSGLVDAPYAEPPQGIPVDRVTERYYRGYCVSTPVADEVIDEFASHHAEMLALIDGETRLDPGFRAKTDRFMERFFAVLSDPPRKRREIIAHCR